MAATTCLPLPVDKAETCPKESTIFEAWLGANGVMQPVGFRFAFCSAQEAADACLQAAAAAAVAWQSISKSASRVPSTWALWVKRRQHSQKRMADQQVMPQSHPTNWISFRSRGTRADDGPENDSARRRAAAKVALHGSFLEKPRTAVQGVELAAPR